MPIGRGEWHSPKREILMPKTFTQNLLIFDKK